MSLVTFCQFPSDTVRSVLVSPYTIRHAFPSNQVSNVAISWYANQMGHFFLHQRGSSRIKVIRKNRPANRCSQSYACQYLLTNLFVTYTLLPSELPFYLYDRVSISSLVCILVPVLLLVGYVLYSFANIYHTFSRQGREFKDKILNQTIIGPLTTAPIQMTEVYWIH